MYLTPILPSSGREGRASHATHKIVEANSHNYQKRESENRLYDPTTSTQGSKLVQTSLTQ